MSAVEAICALGVWFVGWWLSFRMLGRERGSDLPSPRSSEPGGIELSERTRSSWSIVIPARNEEATIGGLLDSLEVLRGCVVDLQVIIVDDHSSDATASIARQAGLYVREAPPLQAHSANPKSAALASICSEISGEICFFFDADVRIDNLELVERAASLVRSSPSTLVSVQPYHRTGRAVESLAIFPNILALLGSGVMRPVSSRRCETAAFGPFLCVNTETYRRYGGHEAIVHASLDDVALARLYRAQGGCVVVASGGSSVSFRMYPKGLRQLIEGFTKNLALGARQVNRIASAAAVLWFVGLVFVTERLVVTDLAHGVVSFAPVVLYLAYLAQIIAIGRRTGRYRAWVYCALPIAELFLIVVTIRSFYRMFLRRSVRWRGRELGIGE